MTKRKKIQERALRFVHGDYTSDHNGLLSISELPSLKLGRGRSIATLTYKIMHNLAPSYLKDLITSTRNSKLLLPFFKSTRHGLNSLCTKHQGFGIPSPYKPELLHLYQVARSLVKMECVHPYGILKFHYPMYYNVLLIQFDKIIKM